MPISDEEYARLHPELTRGPKPPDHRGDGRATDPKKPYGRDFTDDITNAWDDFHTAATSDHRTNTYDRRARSELGWSADEVSALGRSATAQAGASRGTAASVRGTGAALATSGADRSRTQQAGAQADADAAHLYGLSAQDRGVDASQAEARGFLGGTVGDSREQSVGAWNEAGWARRGMYDVQDRTEGQIDYLDRVQRGEAGPSVAELQMKEGLETAQAQALGTALSGRFSPGALRRATDAQSNLGAQANRAAAQLRAQETLDARSQYAQALGLGQAGASGIADAAARRVQLAQGQQGIDQATAAQLAQIGQFEVGAIQDQARINDAMTQAMGQQALGYNQIAQGYGAQAIDYGRLGLEYNQAGLGYDQLAQGYDQMAFTPEEMRLNAGTAQLEADLEFEQGLSDDYYRAMELNNQIELQNVQNRQKNKDRGLLGGGLGSIAGAAALLSDERSKEKIEEVTTENERLRKAFASFADLETEQVPDRSRGDFRDATRIVRAIEPKEYQYTAEAKAAFPDLPKDRQVGVVAQDLEKAAPGMVNTTPSGIKTVDTRQAGMTALAASAAQQRDIDTLNARIAQIEAANRGMLPSSSPPTRDMNEWDEKYLDEKLYSTLASLNRPADAYDYR